MELDVDSISKDRLINCYGLNYTSPLFKHD